MIITMDRWQVMLLKLINQESAALFKTLNMVCPNALLLPRMLLAFLEPVLHSWGSIVIVDPTQVTSFAIDFMDECCVCLAMGGNPV